MFALRVVEQLNVFEHVLPGGVAGRWVRGYAGAETSATPVEAAKANRKTLSLEADHAKVQQAIARLLNILESDVAGDALVQRLQQKEKEARQIEAAITARDSWPKTPSSLEAVDLDMVYGTVVGQLDNLLVGPKEVVIAKELLRQLISEIRVRPDENARDGLAVTILGDLARIVTADSPNRKSAPKGAFSVLSQISMVAGVGFEPTTFRL